MAYSPSSTSTTTTKRFLSYDDLADLMLSRNLQADRAALIARLREVNYYRFTGYLYPFREIKKLADGSCVREENYRRGTTLELVWQFYLFDRRLRFLLMDAIERIEIALRSHIAHYWAEAEGCINPHALRTSYHPAFEKKNLHEDLLKRLQKSYDRSTLDCVMHHKNKGIADVRDLPVWVATELTTIGEMVWMYRGLKYNLQQRIVASFGFSDMLFFDSLLELIHRSRNACAHHSRIWNVSWLQLHVNPTNMQKNSMLPIVKRLPADWNLVWDGDKQAWVPQAPAARPVIPKTSTAFLLMVCNIFLRQVVPSSSWRARFMELMNGAKTPYQAMIGMGLPRHWREHPFFQ